MHYMFCHYCIKSRTCFVTNSTSRHTSSETFRNHPNVYHQLTKTEIQMLWFNCTPENVLKLNILLNKIIDSWYQVVMNIVLKYTNNILLTHWYCFLQLNFLSNCAAVRIINETWNFI